MVEGAGGAGWPVVAADVVVGVVVAVAGGAVVVAVESVGAAQALIRTSKQAAVMEWLQCFTAPQYGPGGPGRRGPGPRRSRAGLDRKSRLVLVGPWMLVFSIVFYQPEIPPNTGNAMRLAAVTGSDLHLIEPLGYTLDDARLRRAGMDYRDRATITVHADLAACAAALGGRRVFALTVDGDLVYTEPRYEPGDVLLFGPESVGLPPQVLDDPWVGLRLRIPMVPGVRSLNLSNAAALVVYEAWRQNGFAGAR